jgi:glutamate 5-kinase
MRIAEVAYHDALAHVEIGGSASNVGTGGAATKVSAAKFANAASIPVLLTATSNVLSALDGADVGTWFAAKE